MSTALNILVCDSDRTYTALNRYNSKTHSFEGEYSLLYNKYSQDTYFLYRFLIKHRGHNLVMIDSDDERYYDIKRHYRHFGEEYVDRYVEELSERQKEEEQDLSMKQNLGQLQLLVAKKMIEQELESVQNQESKSERDTYVLLGQDFAFHRSLKVINQVVSFNQ